MGSKEDDFQTKLLATYQVEANEHLQAISAGVIALEHEISAEQAREVIETIFREAHSLKGAARSVNQTKTQQICQGLEDVLSALKGGSLAPSSHLFDTLHATLDLIEIALSQDPTHDAIHRVLANLAACLKSNTPQQIDDSKKASQQENKEQEEPTPALAPKIPLEAALPKVDKLIQDQTIRTSLSKLDRLFQEAEEMLMVKLISHQTSIELKQLLAKYNTRQKEFEKLLTMATLLKNFPNASQRSPQEHKLIQNILNILTAQQDSIASFSESLSHLTKTSQQNSHFINALIDSLLEDAKKVLMQPISTLFDGLPRMTRDIAKELGKEVQIESCGGDIEVDKRILEEIKDPLIHIVRNAIDHGIESPDERISKGKSACGTIRIVAVETGGGNVDISISDDGKGFDIAKIRAAAQSQRILPDEELASLNDQEAIKLAFHSGISTSAKITELSGRGLGLGIVSEKTEKLSGQVLVESTPDQGTTFHLILPLTLATYRGILLTAEGRDFILPTHHVLRVIRIKQDDIKKVENMESITVNGHLTSFVRLSDILNLSAQETQPENQRKTFLAVLVRSEEKVIAFGADAIHRECEVLVKSLGKQCIRVKNVLAATILESGMVVPILNPVDLVRSAVAGKVTSPKRVQSNQNDKKNILITEDSITTRLMLAKILETAGYNDKTATDGQEAKELMRTEAIDLLLTDVEMPHMNGFELTEKVRETPSLAHLPIIICTSRGSQEDRERGIDLGADAYLDKSSFSQSTLLNTAKRLL